MTERPTSPTRSVDPDVATAIHALRALHHLGDTKTQVALALTAAGITGRTPSTSECVIANYLHRSGVQAPHINVLGDKIVLGFSDTNPDDAEVINTPWPVEEFIDGFDKGEFPWLRDLRHEHLMDQLTLKVLARFADELAEADDLQLIHLAQRAEARYASDLGDRMRDLVDAERSRRVFTAAIAGAR